MKKVLQILTVAILSVSFIGASAGAADCDILVINGTGPGSTNQIVCTTTTTASVVCNGTTYVLTQNSQNAISGSAVVGGNVTGGTAITGNATNENGTTVAIGSPCSTTAAGTTTPTPTTTPSPSATPATVKPAALPNTAGTDTMTVVLVSLAAAAGIVGLSRFAVAAYNRFGNK